MSNHPREFRALQKYWYEKIESEGFEDIEHISGRLKLFHSFYFSDSTNYSSLQFSAQANYFYYAAHFLHDYNFASSFDRDVWALHCGGMSVRQIPEDLRPLYRTINKDSVSKKVRELKGHLMEYITRGLN